MCSLLTEANAAPCQSQARRAKAKLTGSLIHKKKDSESDSDSTVQFDFPLMKFDLESAISFPVCLCLIDVCSSQCSAGSLKLRF